jgi:hypothetical protein
MNLFTAVCGLAVGVLFVAGMMQRQWATPYRWVAASLLVAIVVLAAGLPGKLRANLDALDVQREANAGTYEQEAHERCLRDLGREDLVQALAFAREQLPDDARYYVNTPSTPCVMLNLFPNEPVRAADFDATRDWLVLDDVAGGDLPARVAPAARAAERRVSFSPSFALIAPEGGER